MHCSIKENKSFKQHPEEQALGEGKIMQANVYNYHTCGSGIFQYGSEILVSNTVEWALCLVGTWNYFTPVFDFIFSAYPQ